MDADIALCTCFVAAQAQVEARDIAHKLKLAPLKQAFAEQQARLMGGNAAAAASAPPSRVPSRAPSNATAEELEDHRISAAVDAVSVKHATAALHARAPHISDECAVLFVLCMLFCRRWWPASILRSILRQSRLAASTATQSSNSPSLLTRYPPVKLKPKRSAHACARFVLRCACFNELF